MATNDNPDWHRLVRAAVRECLDTWRLQARGGAVTPKARRAILTRATVLLLSRFDGHPPHLVVALLPGLIQTMLAEFVDVMSAQKKGFW